MDLNNTTGMDLNNTTGMDYNLTTRDQAIHLTVFTILLSCSLVGNITLIMVIFTNKTLKTSFNYLVVNMAISDLFIPLLVIPVNVSNELRLTDEWPVGGNLGAFTCKMYWFFVDLSLAVSIFSLVVMATNRFVAIVYPIDVGLTNTMKRRNKLFIALTWILAAIQFSPHFSFFKLKGKTCALDKSDTKSLTIYYGFIVFVTYFIPFSTITILYVIIISKLYRHSGRLEGSLNDTQYRARQKRNKQIFLLSIVIILSCAVLVGPLFCYIFALSFIFKWRKPKNNNFVFFVLHCIYYLYTSSSPIIYFIFVRSFRQGLKSIFFRQRQNGEHPGSPRQRGRPGTRHTKKSIIENKTKRENIEMNELIS